MMEQLVEICHLLDVGGEGVEEKIVILASERHFLFLRFMKIGAFLTCSVLL